MKTVKLRIPAEPRYMPTVRLVTASVANAMHFDIEMIDDLRVCISEAINAVLADNETIDIAFESDFDADELRMRIRADRRSQDEEEEMYRMSRLILETLLDGVEEKDDCIVLIKKRTK